jgi:hypothetical protein
VSFFPASSIRRLLRRIDRAEAPEERVGAEFGEF